MCVLVRLGVFTWVGWWVAAGRRPVRGHLDRAGPGCCWPYKWKSHCHFLHCCPSELWPCCSPVKNTHAEVIYSTWLFHVNKGHKPGRYFPYYVSIIECKPRKERALLPSRSPPGTQWESAWLGSWTAQVAADCYSAAAPPLRLELPPHTPTHTWRERRRQEQKARQWVTEREWEGGREGGREVLTSIIWYFCLCKWKW